VRVVASARTDGDGPTDAEGFALDRAGEIAISRASASRVRADGVSRARDVLVVYIARALRRRAGRRRGRVRA
jgi:hypothetical protein